MAISLKAYARPDSDLTKLTADVVWKQDITFTVSFVSRTLIVAVSQDCRKFVFDTTLRKRVEQLDTEKFGELLARKIVIGWKGVTLRKLVKLTPLATKDLPADKLDEEIECTDENLKFVFTNCVGLDDYLQEVCTDIGNFQSLEEAAKLEEATKNSSSSPSTT